MTRRTRDNLITAMLVAILLVIVLLVSGCTIYKIQSERDAEGILKTTVDVYTTRNLMDPVVKYTRQGANATFDFGASSTTQPGPQDYAAGVAAGVSAVIGTAPVGVATTPAPGPTPSEDEPQ